jgi:hypothetical protein
VYGLVALGVIDINSIAEAACSLELVYSAIQEIINIVYVLIIIFLMQF